MHGKQCRPCQMPSFAASIWIYSVCSDCLFWILKCIYVPVNKYQPETFLSQYNVLTLSTDTVRNRLREFGLRPRRPYVGLPLIPRRRRVRMVWLTQHRPNLFPLRQWRKVMFSDESMYLLYRADGRQRVYRHNGERYRDNCLVERDRFRGGALMVWPGISYGHRTPLVFIDGPLTAQRYLDVILRPVVVPFVRQHNVKFQQDNAQAHVARLSMAFLQQKQRQRDALASV